MATRVLWRSLLSTANQTLISRFYTTTVLCSRPLVAAANSFRHFSLVRAFSTRETAYSLFDLPPKRSNRPPRETIFLDGCDYEHWLVVTKEPTFCWEEEEEPFCKDTVTRDDIIDWYIKTLAKVVGSYDEAKMRIYSVSTRCYFAFGALMSEEESYKLKEVRFVFWVLPDSYVDAEKRDYGGEPFINGKAVPYHPKYHEAWIRNNARVNVRNRHFERPHNFFERRRENMQSNRSPPGGPMEGPPNNMGPGGAPSSNMGAPSNWSNRSPTDTIHLDGCDFEHWLVVVEKPSGEPTRDEMIDSYINTLAKVVGSYDEAKMKIYSVSTRCYFAFGALVSEEDSYKLKEQPGVLWVVPDSYVDAKNKDYGGEPFINGKAVPYDPKYHEAWIRNTDRANERNSRRRENMQSNRSPPGGPTPNNMGPGGAPSGNMGGPSNTGGAPSGNMGRAKSIAEIVFRSTPGPSPLTWYRPGRGLKPGSPDCGRGVRTRRSLNEVISEPL